jgi:putative tricarboxylic transport membrane protein
MKRPVLLTMTAAAAALALTACSSSAAGPSADGEFSPGERVTMTVPWAAGGGSDLNGRAMASGLEEVTGATVTVTNIEGGSGAVGYSTFLGYEGQPDQLFAAETAMHALPIVQDVKFTYEDFTPIMKVGDDYTVIAVAEGSPYRTCSEVVDAARTGKVVVAVSGSTSLDSVVFSLVEKDQGITFDRIPYESGGEVVAALLGGHVEVASLNPSEVSGQLESGGLVALCTLAPERYDYPLLEDVPTGIEQGIDVAFAQFRGFIAPGGISDEAKQYWIDAAKEYAETEGYTTYIEDNFMQPTALYGDEFSAYLDEYDADLHTALTDE